MYIRGITWEQNGKGSKERVSIAWARIKASHGRGTSLIHDKNLDCVEGRVEEDYQTLGRVHMRVPALSMVVCATRSVDA